MTALAYVELLDASCYHALAFHKRLCLVYSVTRVGLILGPKVLSELSRWIKDASSPYIEEVNPAEIFHVVNALLPQARILALTNLHISGAYKATLRHYANVSFTPDMHAEG